MKGIILAAGKGSRLYPITYETPKPLLPIYDKPMIYYPLSTMVSLGIKDILLIVDEANLARYQDLLGDGKKLGLSIEYLVQYVQRGIADAFILAEDFIGQDDVCLLLGDNLFCSDTNDWLESMTADKFSSGAVVTAYRVRDPERFGVVEFNDDLKVISLEEKPKIPKSNYIVPGLYFYDNRVVEIAKKVQPSARGELEITSVNQAYLELDELSVVIVDKTVSWFDTGTVDSMQEGSDYIRSHLSSYIGMPEVESHRRGLLTDQDILKLSEFMGPTKYAERLREYIQNK